jgi:nucleotide-binding universal stress UspA family protein
MAKKGRGRTILVAVDFSPVSDDVMTYASELAERLDKHLVILHVVHDPGEAPGYYHVKGHDKVLRRIEDVAREMFDKFLARTRKRLPDNRRLRRSKTLLPTGLPVTRILEVVTRLQPWMVVMGSKGRTGMAHVMLGSKAEQVVRLCPVPVMVVKGPRHE